MKSLQQRSAQQPPAFQVSPPMTTTEHSERVALQNSLLANKPRYFAAGRPPVRSPIHRREEILMLQRTIGNQAVGRLLRAGQRREQPEEQRTVPLVNRTGLPDTLKAGIEQLSGLSLDDVRVHYHSAKPAEVQALACTQGTEIHVGPGQEGYLAHEAWHVVQQKQGRVQPTLRLAGGAVNDDQGLEQEAEKMGARARQVALSTGQEPDVSAPRSDEHSLSGATLLSSSSAPIQRAVGFEFQTQWPVREKSKGRWESLPRGVGLFKDASGMKDAPKSLDQTGEFNFLIESDDGPGGSDAEFITPPFNDQASLKLTMKTMQLFEQAIEATDPDDEGRRLLSQIRTKFTKLIDKTSDPRDPSQMLKANTLALDGIAFGDPERKLLNEEGKSVQWFDLRSAAPQATFSIPLENLADVLEEFNVSLSAIDKKKILRANIFHSALIRARRFTATLPADHNWKRLTGFLALVIGVLWSAAAYFAPVVTEKGTLTLAYAKALFPVMLRNDFHALWKKLSEQEKARFKPEQILDMLGMKPDAPVFPASFEVQAIQKAFFGPTRRQWLESIINPAAYNDIARPGDEQVIDVNISREDYKSKAEYEAAKKQMQQELEQKDLLSRGWVRASSYSMGAFATPANEEVRIEWRVLQPGRNFLELKQIEEAATNVFKRYTEALPVVSPTVSIYDWEKRKRAELTLEQVEKMGLERVMAKKNKTISTYSDFQLYGQIYYDPTDKDYWRLIDVVSPGGKSEKGVESGMSTRNKAPYKEYLNKEIIPRYKFVFEAVRREDLPELGLNPKKSQYASIPFANPEHSKIIIPREESMESANPIVPSHKRLPERSPSEEKPSKLERMERTFQQRPEASKIIIPREESMENANPIVPSHKRPFFSPTSEEKPSKAERIKLTFRPEEVDGFFGPGARAAIINRTQTVFPGKDGHDWKYMRNNFGKWEFHQLNK